MTAGLESGEQTSAHQNRQIPGPEDADDRKQETG